MAEPFSVTLEVRGLSELDAMLKSLPEEVQGPIMRAALEAAGEVVRVGAVSHINSRSGRTAKDIRVQVDTEQKPDAGLVAIGGTNKGMTGRNWILRFLEFGARGKKQGGKGWDIKGGSTDQRAARKALRALRRIGASTVAKGVTRGLREGSITSRRALKLPGGVFRAAAHHPGYPAQAPLTRALAESSGHVLDTFKRMLWQGISEHVQRTRNSQAR